MQRWLFASRAGFPATARAAGTVAQLTLKSCGRYAGHLRRRNRSAPRRPASLRHWCCCSRGCARPWTRPRCRRRWRRRRRRSRAPAAVWAQTSRPLSSPPGSRGGRVGSASGSRLRSGSEHVRSGSPAGPGSNSSARCLATNDRVDVTGVARSAETCPHVGPPAVCAFAASAADPSPHATGIWTSPRRGCCRVTWKATAGG